VTQKPTNVVLIRAVPPTTANELEIHDCEGNVLGGVDRDGRPFGCEAVGPDVVVEEDKGRGR
jgi:hypothetical protein